jgi:hypothetical protein
MSATRARSAGVTTAATLAILGSVSALLIWGYFFLKLLNYPPTSDGKRLYEIFPFTFLFFATMPPLLFALGLRTGIGLFQLKPWARVSALAWAIVMLALCVYLIAFRPFETFYFPDHFVTDVQLFKQFLAIASLILFLPVGLWWLFFFRGKSVKLQFIPTDTTASEHTPPSIKNG